MGTLIRNVRAIGAESSIDLRFDARCMVGRAASGLVAHADDRIIDGHGRLATSGFVNAHTHLAMVLFRGLADDVPLQAWLQEHIWPLEKRLKPEDVYWCAMLGIAEGIRGGTTAFADMYFHNEQVARAV